MTISNGHKSQLIALNWLKLNYDYFQFSNGGAAFLAGKGIKNTGELSLLILTLSLLMILPPGEKAAILGAIAGAQHVRLMAKHYGVPVVLHRF